MPTAIYMSGKQKKQTWAKIKFGLDQYNILVIFYSIFLQHFPIGF